MRSIIILYFLSLLFTAQLNAQKYSEGSFSYGIVDVIMEDPDTASINMVKEGMEMEMGKMKIYFTKDKLAITTEGLFGGKKRTVIDPESNLVYTFFELMGEPSYKIDSTKSSFLGSMDISKELEVPFSEGRKNFKGHLGLNCDEFVFDTTDVKIRVELTDAIDNVDLNTVDILQNKNGFLSLMEIIGKADEMTISIGMIDFTSKIDDSGIFKIDTLGRINRTGFAENFLSGIAEGLEEMDKEEKEIIEKFGEYESQAINIDKAKALAIKANLDTSSYFVSSLIRGYKNIDCPNIIKELWLYGEGIGKMSNKNLSKAIAEVECLGPTLKSILEKDSSYWNNIKDDNTRKSAILLAMIQDHLNLDETKLTLVENLQLQEYIIDKSNENFKLFFEPNGNLNHLFLSINNFQKLEQKIEIRNDKLFSFIENFFFTAFENDNIELKINLKGSKISITDGKYQHELNLNNYKIIDYENSDYSKEEPKIEYFENVFVNKEFYELLLPTVKQIAADNNLGYAYSLYDIPYELVTLQETDNIDHIKKVFPEIKQSYEGLYFYKYPREMYDLEFLGTSFKYHPKAFESSVRFRSPRQGTMDAQHEYIDSGTKEKFITYLNNNYDYNEYWEDQKRYIESSLISDMESLLNYIPEGRYSINTFNDDYTYGFYEPTFTKEANNFKDVYYGIHRITKDDFLPTDFSYDEVNHKLIFNWNEKEYSIAPGKESMIRFIQKYNTPAKSGKIFYGVPNLLQSEKTYFYLTPKQKEELNEIVPLGF